MLSKNISVILIGSVSTDIIAFGVKKIAGPGEASKGKELKINPGGKAVNVSRMVSSLTDENNTTAVIGKTAMDPFNLWKVPLDALEKSGVNIDFVQTLPFEEFNKYPTVALIAVDNDGNNQIYGLRGIGDDLFIEDIEKASELFGIAESNGFLVLSLQVPLATAIYAIKKAKQHKLKVLLDPGGAQVNANYDDLFSQEIFLLKPNEHEAKILTGITVEDFDSAKESAQILLRNNIQNVFITHGKYGGYLFNSQTKMHIPVPKIRETEEKDETGCGDQTLAAICASLLSSDNIIEACKVGLLAGTLQYHKSGIIPVTKAELGI